ncbi:MAG: MBL fold metallo-hydrolase [Desulfobulbaceae bacterium]|nr:MBL fold metallo-hydrolase [Desulfobulbaceae bacterium]
MQISFHGAAKNVTGSCHLLEGGGKRILIDCGLYQGSRSLDEENSNDFGFDPGSIDFLILTHAHLDHCGRIPLLVKRGFTGRVLCTSATRELTKLVLLDSARIQEEDAKYQNYKASKRKNPGKPVEPLYTTVDALKALDFFVDIARWEKPHQLAPGIAVTFYDAGHILGSACVLLELDEGGQKRRVLFSGDLGSSDRAIMPDPAPAPQADVVIMETTYGNRQHKDLQQSIAELYEAINTTISGHGNVLIPSFALERSQEILYYLREGIEQGALPQNLRVYLDSPMAISATEIFRNHPECFDEETWQVLVTGRDPFSLPGLHFTRDTADSVALKNMDGAVIIAGSGMATGGRIRHHLRNNLWKHEAAVVFVGFAAQGTLARTIIDGAEEVRIHQDEIAVNARIYTINGFSAHADQKELLAWHAQTKAKRTYLIHGEESNMQAFASLLPETEVIMPELHSVHPL